MTARSNTYRPTVPTHKQRLRTLDLLGAPTFHGIACPTCGAEPPYVCDNPGTGLFAHQSRVDRAMRIAYGQEEQP